MPVASVGSTCIGPVHVSVGIVHMCAIVYRLSQAWKIQEGWMQTLSFDICTEEVQGSSRLLLVFILVPFTLASKNPNLSHIRVFR